jgi:hypothetical protein
MLSWEAIMRGGRNIVEGAAKIGRAGSAGMPVIWMPVGIESNRTLGNPWKPQQGQTPLQSSGAAG